MGVHRAGRLVAAATLVAAALVLARGSSAAAVTAGDVTSYPNPAYDPIGIVAGPDGAMWFADWGSSTIGRIAPNGTVSKFANYRGIGYPQKITVGPDGALWFTNQYAKSIGRITTSGQATRFKAPGIDQPYGVTTGPDGALWFTNATGHSIGRITTDGTVSIFTDERTITTDANPAITSPQAIAAGPDGALWFFTDGSAAIGRLTTSGKLTTFTAVVGDQIAAGPDGNMWFTSQGAILRITTGVRVPGAPTIATNATAGNASATVSWTAPTSDGRSPITGYVVTPIASQQALPSTTFNDTATTHTITGLTNGTKYRFKVAAINAAGTGRASTASNLLTPLGAPDAPTVLKDATAGDGSATVNWLAPASDGGSPITGYSVTPFIGYFPLSPITFDDTATTHTITGLTNGTTYRFKVAAINAIGTGPMSTVTNAVTPTASVSLFL